MMKKKKLLFIFIIAGILLVLLFFGYFFLFQEDKVAVLTYHNVVDIVSDPNTVDISVSKFESQIKWLSDNGYTSLSMDDFYDWKVNNKKVPRKSILITFDDGWHSFYTKAIPILEKYNMKASVFVVWKYSENCTNRNEDIYMNLEEIKDVVANHSNMSILSHSYELHEKERALSKDYNLYSDDMKKVKQLSGIDIKYYAYPFGNRNDEYISALKDNDYKLAFTFGPYDFAVKSDSNYEIPRIGLFESTPDWKFKLKMFLKR